MTDTIEALEFSTDDGFGTRARMGLIVLQTDQTIEHEFAQILGSEKNVALYAARIPNAMEVSADTLRQMAIDLPRTAALLPTQFGFDVLGYACTSGATMIGEDRVDSLIREVHPQAKTTNPISASKAALAFHCRPHQRRQYLAGGQTDRCAGRLRRCLCLMHQLARFAGYSTRRGGPRQTRCFKQSGARLAHDAPFRP
jgi:hypothetical protein